MKRIILLGLVLFVACWPALAQKSMVSAQIPFPFYVGDAQYPAGEYFFEQTNSPDGVLFISGTKQKSYKTNTDVSRMNTVKESKLVFLNDGDKMVLHQVWIAGDNHVHDIRHSPKLSELPAAGY